MTQQSLSETNSTALETAAAQTRFDKQCSTLSKVKEAR